MDLKDWIKLYIKIATFLKLPIEEIEINNNISIEKIKEKILKLYEEHGQKIKNENPKLFEKIILAFQEEKNKQYKYEMTPEKYQQMVEIMKGNLSPKTEDEQDLETIAMIYLERIKNMILNKYEDFVKLIIPKLEITKDLKIAIKYVLKENPNLTQNLLPFDPITTNSTIIDRALLNPLINELNKDQRILKILVPKKQKEKNMNQEVKKALSEIFKTIKASGFYLTSNNKLLKIAASPKSRRFKPQIDEEEFDPTGLIIDPSPTPDVAYEEKLEKEKKMEKDEELEKELEAKEKQIKEIEEIEPLEILNVIKDIAELFKEKIGHIGKSELLLALYLIKDPKILSNVRHALAKSNNKKQVIEAIKPIFAKMEEDIIFKILVKASNLSSETKEKILSYNKEELYNNFYELMKLIENQEYVEVFDKLNLIAEKNIIKELTKSKPEQGTQETDEKQESIELKSELDKVRKSMIELIEKRINEEIEIIEESAEVTDEDKKNIINKIFEHENYYKMAKYVAEFKAKYFSSDIKTKFLQIYYQATPKIENILSKGEQGIEEVIIEKIVDYLIKEKDKIKAEIEQKFKV